MFVFSTLLNYYAYKCHQWLSHRALGMKQKGIADKKSDGLTDKSVDGKSGGVMLVLKLYNAFIEDLYLQIKRDDILQIL